VRHARLHRPPAGINIVASEQLLRLLLWWTWSDIDFRLFGIQVEGKEYGLLRKSSDMSADGMAQLTESFEAQDGLPEHTLLPFLRETAAGDGDGLLAAAQWQPLLRCLGTTAPAIQLLPSILWDAARELVTTKKLTSAAEGNVLRYSPLLHGFLRPYLGAPECDGDILRFVTSLLEVCTVRFDGRCQTVSA